MESNDRRQRQSHPSGYASQQGLISTPQQYSGQSGSDRFRQASLTGQSPTSAPNAGRYSYGYGSDSGQFVGPSMQSGGMPYSSEYSQERAQTQTHQSQPQQQYSQYGSNMLYNVPGQQQASPQSPYESVQPYQHRQSAAIEALSSQFGVSQNYYVQGDSGTGGPGPTSTPTGATMAQQNVPPQYSGLAYTSQDSPIGRQSLASASYTPGMTDPATHGSGAYGSHGYSGGGGRQQQQQSQPSQQPQQDLSAAFNAYQDELKRVFEHVRDGRLDGAGRLLTDITGWLLSNAEVLGLVKDDETQHAERLRLWETFNRAWLALLQAQKDAVSEALASGQRPQQSLLNHDTLEQMGRELVRQCDAMEKHGLVDYELGVWEEEIVSLLMACLELLEDERAQTILGSAIATGTSTSSNPVRRR